MAQSSLYRKFGALKSPIPRVIADDLSRLDPARDILLNLFAAALNYELDGAWRGLATAPAQFRGAGGESPRPVQQALPILPTPEALGEMKVGWPLLTVGRSQEKAQFGDYTIELRMLTQRWDVDYILCPLAVGSLMRAQDLLPAVGKIIEMVIENRGHRAYRTTASGNQTFAANVLGDGDDCCGFINCRVLDMALGPAQFVQGGPKYYACGLTLESVELSNYLTDAAGDYDDGEAVPLEGATATFGLTQSGDPSIIVRD